VFAQGLKPVDGRRRAVMCDSDLATWRFIINVPDSGAACEGCEVLINVKQKSRGDFVATIFELPDGRVIVVDNTSESANLFASEQAWEEATTPYDALETHDSVTDAFLDVLPVPESLS